MKWFNKFLTPRYVYAEAKLFYATALFTQKRLSGCPDDATLANWFKDFFKEKMTYLYRSEGQEMAPTIPGKHETLLIRNLPCPRLEYSFLFPGKHETLLIRNLLCPDLEFRFVFDQVSVGDVVLLKNPLDSDKFLVRRLAALGGQEMVSTDEKDEPFVIDNDQCWVLSDNKELKPRETKDSRTFGPVPVMDIMGRVIYRFQSMKDHGLVINSNLHSEEDTAITNFELELDEMQKFCEA